MYKFLFLFLAVTLFTAVNLNAQVEVSTLSNQEIKGIVAGETADSLSLKLIDGSKITIAKSQIEDMQPCETTVKARIESKSKKPKFKTYNGSLTAVTDSSYTIQNKSGVSFNINRADVKSIDIVPVTGRKAYPMFGLTLLMPGGLNALFGYQFTSGIGFRVEAGYIGTLSGFQGNFMYNLSKSRSFEHNLSIGFGHMSGTQNKGLFNEETKTWTYAGLFYDLNIYGLFLELGVTAGSGGFTNPQIAFQFGYVYRFN